MSRNEIEQAVFVDSFYLAIVKENLKTEFPQCKYHTWNVINYQTYMLDYKHELCKDGHTHV
jgi:hypothetical protein